jgi:hypothetical protein
LVAVGLVLSVHVLLALLMVFGSRVRPRTPEEFIAFFGLWVEPPLPKTPTAPDAPPPRQAVRPVAPGAVPAAPVTEAPSSAITLPPTIDWLGEAAAFGRRRAEPKGPDTFSPPPETVRKACTPPESSFVWNPELPRAGFTRTPIPLPFVRLGERCVVGLGFFGCNVGALPKANSHLFDDMEEGKTRESSVPDPNVCD